MSKLDIKSLSPLEMAEIIQKLHDNGHGHLVECLLENEKECYTKKARLNKSSTCRKLGWKGKELEDAMKQMKLVLKNEFDFDIDEDED